MTKPAATSRCRRLLVEMSQYLEGELSAGQCRAIDRHLTSCESCAGMAERIRETIAACRAAKDQPLPEDVRQRAALRIKALLAGEAG